MCLAMRLCIWGLVGVGLMTSSSYAQLTELALYHFGEDDAGAVAGGVVSSTTESIEGFLEMTSFGTVTYSDDTPPGIPSTLSVAFDGEPDNYLFTDATAWQNFYPGFRVGMEAWLKVDPEAEGLDMVPFGNGTGYFLSIGARSPRARTRRHCCLSRVSFWWEVAWTWATAVRVVPVRRVPCQSTVRRWFESARTWIPGGRPAPHSLSVAATRILKSGPHSIWVPMPR